VVHNHTIDGAGVTVNGQTAGNIAATATNNGTTAVNIGQTATNNGTVSTEQNTGSGNAHTNVQPYVTVYMWKRVA